MLKGGNHDGQFRGITPPCAYVAAMHGFADLHTASAGDGRPIRRDVAKPGLGRQASEIEDACSLPFPIANKIVVTNFQYPVA